MGVWAMHPRNAQRDLRYDAVGEIVVAGFRGRRSCPHPPACEDVIIINGRHYSGGGEKVLGEALAVPDIHFDPLSISARHRWRV
jgi:hypothetical protein